MIEILRFRLVPGTDTIAFLDADKQVQTEFAYQQPGLVRRTTARGADGEWIVVDLWHSAEAADDCNAKWGRDDVTKAFMSFLDGESISTSRYLERD